MKKPFFILSICLLLGGMAHAQMGEVVTNKTVIDLFKAGLDSSVIISKINSSDCKFDLSSSQLVSLKKAGIPSSIIKTMLEKQTGVMPHPVLPENKSTASKVPILTTLSEVAFYDHKTQSAKPLEKGKAQIVDKGLIGKSLYFQLDGPASSVQLSAGDQISFLVKLTDAQGEPTGWFALYKADVKNGKRITLWAKSLSLKKDATDNNINYSDNPVGGGEFELIPAKKLDKGEYFFVSKGSIPNYGQRAADVFAFTVN